MTVRKQITLIIGSILILAVAIYAVVSTAFVNKSFSGYVESEYKETIDRIKVQAEKILTGEIETEDEAYEALSAYRSSLIGNLSVFDNDEEVIVSVGGVTHMMRGSMMGTGRSTITDIDYFDIKNEGIKIGTLAIGRTSSISDSDEVYQFKKALRGGAFISIVVALLVSVIIIFFAGKRMTKDLRMTVVAAGKADKESLNDMKLSNVTEIRAIQQSLSSLSSKLGLQKRIRREKVDQLVHEVRTPLTILKTNVEGARDKVIQMDDKRLESCLIEIDYLSNMLGTISDVVEYDGKDIEVNIEKFDIASLIYTIRQGFKLQFENKDVKLSVEGEKHIEIVSDKSLISQALYNLISNAYKFTPEGGKVEILIEAREKKAIISISDCGEGVPEEDRERIFEAYQRGQNTKKIKGEGLGLYIAQNNIKALGGAISLKDSIYGGAEFIVEIPSK